MGGPVGKVISQEDIGLKIAFPPVVKCMIQIQVIAFDPGFCNGIQANGVRCDFKAAGNIVVIFDP